MVGHTPRLACDGARSGRLPQAATEGRKQGMSQGLNTARGEFVDRRNYDAAERSPVGERRQFANTHEDLSPDARELAYAIDEYKLHHRRRFITYEEMLAVVKSLGYHK